MLPNYGTGRIHYLAALGQLSRAAFVIEIAVNEFRIFPIRDKAYFLRLLLFCRIEICTPGDVANLFLLHLAQRKVGPRELILRQFP